MAKRDARVNYSELSLDEIRSRLSETREKLFRARFKHASAPLKNPLEIRGLRREVARLSTFLQQRGKS